MIEQAIGQIIAGSLFLLMICLFLVFVFIAYMALK